MVQQNRFDTSGYNALFTDNITADYFIGDGSLLTSVGTVTSIATTAPISGGTITSTGTISLDTATPSDGDTAHASTADQIFDWAVGLFMQDLVDDTVPQLGGRLRYNGHDIGSTTDEIENIM